MKHKITKEIVLKDYRKLIKLAFFTFNLKLYSQSMDIIANAANLMYNFNIIYTDNEIESLLIKIAQRLFANVHFNSTTPNQKSIVFYDYFSLDNRGLTEQYLQGLMDLNYEILYITLQKNPSNMQNILSKLSKYPKSEVFQVKSDNNILACNEIIKKITKFAPSKILFHSAPWDTIGFVSLSIFEGRIDRFLINLTDHAYWLGKMCCDYFIEFRTYGLNISTKYRKINKNKLLILPYYPITNSKYAFEGFPFNTNNKKIIFSGGSLYKIYGSQVFFDIVKYILNSYKDTLFFFLGNGDERPLLNFIKENKLENRFYYSKERKDINEVFRHCHFYLGTYPICGGLMSQFAVQNNKIPVAYTGNDLPVNNIDELFINLKDITFTYTDIQKVYEEIDRLLTDNDYYLKKTSKMKNLVISSKDFAIRLKKCFEDKFSDYQTKEYDIDTSRFSNIYIDQENNFLHNYCNYVLFKRNFFISIFFIKYTIFFILCNFFNKCIKKK